MLNAFLIFWHDRGLTPSFSIGAPFGAKRKEVTAEGHIILRKASTRYYGSESLESIVQRICKRNNNGNINFVLSHLEIPVLDLAKHLVFSTSLAEFLSSSGTHIMIVDESKINFPGPASGGAKAFSAFYDTETHQQAKVMIQNGVITTTDLGSKLLERSLLSLKKEIKEDLKEDL